ncbi:hypothetical protein AS149_14195 [Burkholderia cenocepacia]|nr:hypothetical protein AS149_14195 [Burkholderia cenocepacia]
MTAGLKSQVSREKGICLDLEIESPFGAGDRANDAACVVNVFGENAGLLVHEHDCIFAAFCGIDFDHESHDFSRGGSSDVSRISAGADWTV